MTQEPQGTGPDRLLRQPRAAGQPATSRWPRSGRINGENSLASTVVNAGEIHLHEKTGIELVRIPAGEFLFGDALVKTDVPSFWIGRTPVTYQQYSRFLIDQPDYDRDTVTGETSERLAESAVPRRHGYVVRCQCVLQLGRIATANRGRVGKGCPRDGRQDLSLGQRPAYVR